MSKTALLAQNDNLAIDKLKQSVGRSVFDLSHTSTFPIDVEGAIIPICCVETVPSDSFDISVECLLRQLSPLAVPLMTRFKLCTAFYYCDNRLAWKKWDRFMTGGRSGTETYDIPRVANISRSKEVEGETLTKYSLADVSPDDDIDYKTTLHTYFGIAMNHTYSENDDYDDITDDSDELPLAFPFFDYQIICRDFYTDVDRLHQKSENDSDFWKFDNFEDWQYENLFPVDDDEFRLVDGVQIKSGWTDSNDSVSGKRGCLLDKIRYHNVREDYFTTSKKAPMRGDVPEIDTTVAVSNIDFSDVVLKSDDTPGNNGILVAQDTELKKFGIAAGDSGHTLTFADSAKNYKFAKTVNSSISNSANLNVIGDSSIVETLNKIKINLSTTKAINAAELRLLSQLTVWQELNMLHKPYYNDFLNAHFSGVSVGESAVEKPIYIGGSSQIININEVLQTSQSTESSPLGNQAAVASSLQGSHIGSVYCNNYGYIIGVAFIIPDLYYNPAMPRNFSRRTKEDFYSPEFANLSMQAILNKELFYSNDDEWNNQPLGYTGAYDELRSIPNRVAGDLLNSSYTDLKKWVLRREFDNDNKPALNTEFLSEKDNIDKDAWSVKTMPAFMLQVANYIKAVRPMPYVAIPKAL